MSGLSTVSTRDKILNSIIELRNKYDNSVVSIQTKEVKFESSKYSSVKNNIWQVFINNWY